MVGKCLQKVALGHAAAEFGTPLYWYDLNGIRDRYRDLVRLLPGRVAVHYALKANASLAICQGLAHVGAAADVCSPGELVTARAAGFDPARIVYTGPAKTDSELEQAVLAGVGRVAVESLGECQRLARIAGMLQSRQAILLRVHFHTSPGIGGLMRFEGGKFGFLVDNLLSEIKAIRRLDALRIDGLFFHTESCVRDAQVLIEVQRGYLDASAKLATAGVPISFIDLGGGIGVPYTPDEPAFDVNSYGKYLQKLLSRYPDHWHYSIDPGRYIVAQSGVFVTQVIDVKIRVNQRWILVDGGIHNLYRSRFKHANAMVGTNAEGSNLPIPTAIAGPLLTPDDVLAENIRLPELRPGHLVYVENTGAYGFGHGLQGFCLQGRCCEVGCDDGWHYLLRARGRADDVLNDQHLVGQSHMPKSVKVGK